MASVSALTTAHSTHTKNCVRDLGITNSSLHVFSANRYRTQFKKFETVHRLRVKVVGLDHNLWVVCRIHPQNNTSVIEGSSALLEYEQFDKSLVYRCTDSLQTWRTYHTMI